MATTSAKLQQIKRELQAQKVAFSRASSQLPLYTKNLVYNTKKNACRATDLYPPYSYYDYEGNERVVVTLNTPSGANTLATLEINGNYDTYPVVRRVPYSGGARWVVATSPRYNWDDHTWRTTTYNFTVQTLVDGVLTAAMFWEVS